MTLGRLIARFNLLSSPGTHMLRSALKGKFRRGDAVRRWLLGPAFEVPQRYGQNRPRYAQRDQALDLDRLRDGFVEGTPNNGGDMARFYFLCLAFDQLFKESVEGDVAELGVYRGNTAGILADFARRRGQTAWLLDTFEGFAKDDLEGVDANKQMEFADTSLEAVRARVGEQNVRYIKGYFPGSAVEIPPDTRFSLVHIDCDLYQPFRSALPFFYERLVPGGFLVMHDYSSMHWDGAERAVDEFFADKPECVMPLPDASGTVIIRKSRIADKYANWYVGQWNPGFLRIWVDAGHGNISDLLRSGWSTHEDWGVWGIGPVHELMLYPACRGGGELELDADVEAVVIGSRTEQYADVCCDGKILTTWVFTMEQNRAVRTVRIPVSPAIEGRLPELLLEIRPRFLEAPSELDPTVDDTRPLGIGLRRFRQRVFHEHVPSDLLAQPDRVG